MQKIKFIHNSRHTKLKFLHSSMLSLSVLSSLVVLFCIVCISFRFLSCVVSILLPYAVSAVLGLVLYLFLLPLHEAGLFYTSFYYRKKYNIPAKMYIEHARTISSDWGNFGSKRVVIILRNGSLVKIGYCVIMFLMMLFTGNIKSSLIFLFAFVFEYSLNCTPIKADNDYNLIHNLKIFYDEKGYVDKHRAFLERYHKIRVLIWGILWQVIIAVFTIFILLYKPKMGIVDVLAKYMIDYRYK